MPLVECVSEPDLRSPEEAGAYLRELRSLLEALDVSDVRMEEGSLRCDANVSVRPPGAADLGTKVEIKNMNSVRSLEHAIRFEIRRQSDALDAGEVLVQETRHWNEDTGETTSMRSKEEAFDYRYFPEPDIPSLEPDASWVEALRDALPELPAARRARYERELGLRSEPARILSGSRTWAAFFDEVVAAGTDPVAAGNWLTQDLAGTLNKTGADLADTPVRPNHIADIVRLVADGTISSAGGKHVLEEVVASGGAVEAIVEAKGLRQVSDAGELGSLVDRVLADNDEAVERFRAGNEGTLGFLVGQVMKASGGSANPKLAGELLRERLRS